jgi:hypothetical protein
MSLTFVEKTRPNRHKRKAPILVAIEIPELSAKAYRPDVNDDGGYIYYLDRGFERTDEIRLDGTSADEFRRVVRVWAERKAEELGVVLEDGQRIAGKTE